MRVACLVTSFPTVSETFILDQITGLIDLGCDVEIFAALPETAAAMHPEVEAYRLMDRRHLAGPVWRRPRPVRFLSEMLSCARRPLFDVIHCHFGPNGLRGLKLRDMGALHGKLVTSFYGYDVSEFHRKRRSRYAPLFARGDRFLAVGEAMRRNLIQSGCDPDRTVVQRLGVEPRMFAVNRDPAAARPFRILTVGRMVPKKGLEYGLRAVADLALEEPDIEYTIIGDGPLRNEIERMVASLGLGNIARLKGWKNRPEIVEAMGGADVLLAPSVTAESGDAEGTPVAIMEALAAGLPVVSSLHAGIPEIVQEGRSGFLVPERDVQGLTAALRRLVRNPELRARMGAVGRAAVEERHDIGKLNRRLLGIYRDVAETRPGEG